MNKTDPRQGSRSWTVIRSPWMRTVLASASLGLIVASSMSFVDWTLNPAGIFHGEDGTSWKVVWETWISWFIPVFVLSGGLALPFLLWYSRRK